MAELTEDQKTIAALQKQVATLTDEKTAALNQVTEATAVVTDLKSQLAEKAAGTIQLPSLKIGSDMYELVGGDFTYNAKEVTLDILKEDSKLAAELVKEGVGNLRKLAKAK